MDRLDEVVVFKVEMSPEELWIASFACHMTSGLSPIRSIAARAQALHEKLLDQMGVALSDADLREVMIEASNRIRLEAKAERPSFWPGRRGGTLGRIVAWLKR